MSKSVVAAQSRWDGQTNRGQQCLIILANRRAMLLPTQMTTLNTLTSRLCLVKNHKTPSTMIATL
ncbi:hypothetical protein ACTOVL_07185 [Arcanobacterium canis]